MKQQVRSWKLDGRVLAILAGTTVGLAGQPLAAENSAPVQEKILLTAPFSSPGGDELTAKEVVIAPGASSPRHRHAGYLYVHVLSGAIRSQLNDGPMVVYRAGDSWVEPPGTIHSHTENVSATEPVKLLVVFVAPKGAQLTTFDK